MVAKRVRRSVARQAEGVARVQPTVTSALDEKRLLGDLRELIHSARQRVATVANSAQVLLYWRLGMRILSEKLVEGRGEYGQRILATLSQELVSEFGTGFSYSALTRMARLAEMFPDEPIVVTLSQQLGWSHFLALRNFGCLLPNFWSINVAP